MSYIKKYPLVAPLTKIEKHDQLPENSQVIGNISYGHNPEDNEYIFLKRGNFLSIIGWCVQTLKNGRVLYICDQYDFPLKVLSWFPKALEEFKKPSAQGGLHAGAMISGDQNVDGEMLAVGSMTDGYNLKNRSRDADGMDADPDYYEPTNLSLPYELLEDYGLLALWKDLGEKYERGEL